MPFFNIPLNHGVLELLNLNPLTQNRIKTLIKVLADTAHFKPLIPFLEFYAPLKPVGMLIALAIEKEFEGGNSMSTINEV